MGVIGDGRPFSLFFPALIGLLWGFAGLDASSGWLLGAGVMLALDLGNEEALLKPWGRGLGLGVASDTGFDAGPLFFWKKPRMDFCCPLPDCDEVEAFF